MAPRHATPIALEPRPRGRKSQPQKRRKDIPEVILAAATRCFEQWGIQRTRVEDIAHEADIPRPHIYRHYASKDAIVHAVILRAIERHHDRLARRFPIAGPAADLILATLVSGVRDAAGEVQALTRVDSAHVTARSLADSPEIMAALQGHWQTILEHARERGELREHVEVEAATRWLVFIQLSYLALGTPQPKRELEQELRAFVLPALLTDGPTGA